MNVIHTSAPYSKTLSAYLQAHHQIDYSQGEATLNLAVQHIMNLPGKRIRPLLLLECCKMFGGNPQDAIPAALAYEMFHNFTLVHDDIMDNAPLRRGQITVHEKFGVRQAILAGDLLLLKSYRQFETLNTKWYKKCLSIFTEAALQIMEGQQMDMNFEAKAEIYEAEYLQMIQFKTSVLLAAAAQTGVLLGGADEQQQNLCYQFALQLGIAFQIKDDYLDLYGGQRVGKQKGGDILQDKKTYLKVLAEQLANEPQKKQFLDLKNWHAQQKIEQVISIYNDLEIPEKTMQKMHFFYEAALDNLNQIDVSEAQKFSLRTLAKDIFERHY